MVDCGLWIVDGGWWIVEGSEHDGSRAGMIARHRILLLEAGFVFLVDNDEAEVLERQEYSGTSAKDDVVGMA